MDQGKPQTTTPVQNTNAPASNDPPRNSSGQFTSTAVRPSPVVTGTQPAGRAESKPGVKPEATDSKPDQRKVDAERRVPADPQRGPVGTPAGVRK